MALKDDRAALARHAGRVIRAVVRADVDVHKTQGVTGKPVRCVAAGYVARVAVLHGGYGQVVYVNHPNGLTSVYGHVISFAPAIQQAVRAYQYARETFVCDLTFAPGELPAA